MRMVFQYLFKFGLLVVILKYTLLCSQNKQEPSAAANTTESTANHVSQTNLPEPSAIDLHFLTAGQWIMASATANQPCDTNYDGVFTTDMYSELPNCCHDDVINFYENGEVLFTLHKRCDSGEQPYQKYSWTLDSSMTLTLYDSNIVAPMVIKSLDKDQMTVLVPFDTNGDNPSVTVTYKRPKQIENQSFAVTTR